MPTKKQSAQLTWLKIAVEVLLLLGGVWALAAIAGDNRWAERSTAEHNINQLRERVQHTEQLDQQHHSDSNYHMSEASKYEYFVTRKEWEVGRSEVKAELADIKNLLTEQRGDIKQLLQR